MNTTINKIAGYRNMLGLTQVDMAKYLDISPQSYSNKERGYRSFNDFEKTMIKEIFSQHFENITIDSLFF